MSKYCTFLAAAVACLAVSAPALANPTEIAVTYKDLNLASPDGRAKLDHRLDNAAAEVCSAHGTHDLASKDVARRCHQAAMSDAREKAQIVVARAKGDQEVASAK
jgi:UrcA family protein